MPLVLSDSEYGELKNVLDALLGALPSADEKVGQLKEKMGKLHSIFDARVGIVKVPVGTRPAYPVWSIPAQDHMPGMTYRQWLIGQVLPKAMQFSRSVPSTDPGKCSAFVNEAAEIAILTVDATLLLLETEQQLMDDDNARKEKPDGPSA